MTRGEKLAVLGVVATQGQGPYADKLVRRLAEDLGIPFDSGMSAGLFWSPYGAAVKQELDEDDRRGVERARRQGEETDRLFERWPHRG